MTAAGSIVTRSLEPLARTHDDLVRCEVDVFHAQPRALQHAESRPVQEERRQTRYARELAEDGSNLFACQDDWQTPGTLRVQDAVQPRDLLTKHLAVQESSALSAWFWVAAATLR